MNWEALGAIAELISGIGVIGTLVYLAIQIRHNTRSVRETNLRSQTDRAIGHSRFVVSTPELMDIFRRGSTDYHELTPDERWQFGTFFFSMAQGWQETFHLHLESRSEEFYWKHQEKTMLVYLYEPGGREWWDTRGRNLMDEEFVAYVDALLEGSSAMKGA